MTRGEMRGSLELLAIWVLAQKAVANRRSSPSGPAAGAGEQGGAHVSGAGVAWPERQAEAAEQRQADGEDR